MIHILFGTAGRISRKDYWLQALLPLALALLGLQASHAFAALAPYWLAFFLPMALMYAIVLARSVRRVHDIGLFAARYGTLKNQFGLAGAFLVTLLFLAPILRVVGQTPGGAFGLMMVATPLLLVMALGGMRQFRLLALTPGQPGENVHGPDPRQQVRLPPAPRPLAASPRIARPQSDAFLSGVPAPRQKRHRKSAIGDWGAGR